MPQLLSDHEEDLARHILQDGRPGLVRFVSVADVLKAAQSVTAIAKMAGVDRRTVQRHRITAGTWEAVDYIRNVRDSRSLRHYTENGYNPKATPLFHQAGFRPPVMLKGKNVINEIQRLAGSRDFPAREPRVIVDRSGANSRRFQMQKGKTKRFRNEARAAVRAIPPGAPTATPEELKRSVYYQMKDGRLSVKWLCSYLKISRAGFYKWLGGLTVENRELVKQQLRNPHRRP